MEEQKKELLMKDTTIKSLQKDYELLFKQSEDETKSLEAKEKEIERLKRSLNKTQKDLATAKNDQRRGSRMPASSVPLTKPPEVKRKNTLVP